MIAHLHDLTKNETYATDPHQIDAYFHLHDNDRAALFLEMSLSKTVTVLSYLFDMIYHADYMHKVLVVAPDKVARITWPNEIKKWRHLERLEYTLIEGTPKQRLKLMQEDTPVHIISEGNLVWLINQYVHKRTSKHGTQYGPYAGSLPYDTLVIDELSMFKNPQSVKFKTLRRALRMSNVDKRIGLTGTPASNGYQDLWAQMFILDDGERLGEFNEEFLREYFHPGQSNGMKVLNWRPKKGAVQKISDKISDIALTMKTREHIELPPEHILDEVLDFDGYDREVYDMLERDYVLDFLEDVSAKNAADLANKLLQVTSGAIYDEYKEAHQLNTLKMDMLRDIVHRYPTENIIVVYQFRHELQRILAEFPDAVEFGKGKVAERNFKAWNSGEIPLMIIHPASAGHGLNLQFGGRRMVFMTPTWNLEHWLQTIARLVRRGAEWDVFIHRLLVRGTIDMKVATRIKGKQSDQDFLFKIVKDLKYAS